MASPTETYLKEKEIEAIATSAKPHMKLLVLSNDIYHQTYLGTETSRLLYPTKDPNHNLSNIVDLIKVPKSDHSDQYGYLLASRVIKEKFLRMAEDDSESKERSVTFAPPKDLDAMTFHQTHFFNLIMDPHSETKFALYTSAPDSKGYNKLYYLTPKSGTIMAEERSSSADVNYNFSMSESDDPRISKELSYKGPLTLAEISSTSVEEVIKFVFLKKYSSQLCYLDTEDRGFRYGPLPEKENLSVLMKLTTVGPSQYKISTHVCPDAYLTITSSQSYPGEFIVRFEILPSCTPEFSAENSI